MASMMIVSKFEKSQSLLKSSVPLPWQPNLIKQIYILIKFVVAFHVDKWQQLYLPVNSTIDKREKKPSKTFQPIYFRQQHYQLNFQTK